MKVTARTMKAGTREVKDKDGKVTEVPAKVTDKEVACEVAIPSTFAELVSSYGEELVAKAAEDAIVISAQAIMRRHLAAGKSQAEIQTVMDTWKPDVKSVVRQTALEKATSAVGQMTAQERADLLAKLQAMA